MLLDIIKRAFFRGIFRIIIFLIIVLILFVIFLPQISYEKDRTTFIKEYEKLYETIKYGGILAFSVSEAATLDKETLTELKNKVSVMNFQAEGKPLEALNSVKEIFLESIDLILLEKQVKEKWFLVSGFEEKEYCMIIDSFKEIDSLNEQKIKQAENIVKKIKEFNEKYDYLELTQYQLNSTELEKFILTEKQKIEKEKNTTMQLEIACK